MLELILTEVVAGLGVAGVTRLAKTAHSRMSEKTPLEVRMASLAQYLPRREALAKPIAASDIESLSFNDFLEEYIYGGRVRLSIAQKLISSCKMYRNRGLAYRDSV